MLRQYACTHAHTPKPVFNETRTTSIVAAPAAPAMLLLLLLLLLLLSAAAAHTTAATALLLLLLSIRYLKDISDVQPESAAETLINISTRTAV